MNDLVPVKKEQIVAYLQAFNLAGKLTKEETTQFVEVAQAYNLNPFKREIYCVPYGQGEGRKLSIITGYEVYLKRAERSGLLRGWKAWTEGSGDSLKACIDIHRDGWAIPFHHEVKIAEYRQDNKMWREKPETMLQKVVTGQGFRLCFSEELGGMPYTAEEYHPEEEAPRDVTPEPKTAEQLKAELATLMQSPDLYEAGKVAIAEALAKDTPVEKLAEFVERAEQRIAEAQRKGKK